MYYVTYTIPDKDVIGTLVLHETAVVSTCTKVANAIEY